MLETYHKQNPLITNRESETNSNNKKTFISSRNKRKLVIILVQNVHERKETYLRNILEI